MLHRIKPASCSPALDWVVKLQRDTLVALCDPKTTSTTVTSVWIAGIQPVVGQWLAKFCSRSYDRETLIARMRRIANLDPVQKSAILQYFDNNQEFSRAFVAGEDPENPLIMIQYGSD